MMLNRAYRLSSNQTNFIDQCEALDLTSSNIRYPPKLINQFITNIITDNILQRNANRNTASTPRVMLSLPFMNQKAVDSKRGQLESLRSRISVSLQPVMCC